MGVLVVGAGSAAPFRIKTGILADGITTELLCQQYSSRFRFHIMCIGCIMHGIRAR